MMTTRHSSRRALTLAIALVGGASLAAHEFWATHAGCGPGKRASRLMSDSRSVRIWTLQT